MATIAIVGTGYVGLVTGACLAELGNQVRCIDIDAAKIALLQQGEMPIYEPGLQEIVQRNCEAGRLSFHTEYRTGLAECEFAFICVDTPADSQGRPCMDRVEAAIGTIIAAIATPIIIVNKSTVPVGTGNWMEGLLESRSGISGPVDIVSCPEFLREGSAVRDFMCPDRIVLGCTRAVAAARVAQLFEPMNTETLITNLSTAEMIKLASNAYLATRITFVNHIARVCEAVGTDVKDVVRGLSLDARIGPHFLRAGLGFGGSCFPKDVRALKYLGESLDVNSRLLEAVLELNQAARLWVIEQIKTLLGPDLTGMALGILGLAFKPGTNDLREAPALDIIADLQARGARIRAYDPVAMAEAKRLNPALDMASSPYELASGLDALVVCTEWNEFYRLDMVRVARAMRRRILIDGRNIYDPETLQALGFTYRGVGRGHVPAHRDQGHA